MIRTISYDPESFRRLGERIDAVRHPEWILCRKLKQFPIDDSRELQRLAEEGRILPGDVLINPAADAMVHAGELPELKVYFRKAAVRRVKKFSPTLARMLSFLWSRRD
jgi:hypothetical protein